VALVFSFLAVDNIGLALGQGVWGGIAILVSYLWGVVAFGERPSNVALSVMGVCVLICGVSVIAFCEPIGIYIAGQWDRLGNGARSSMGDLYSPLSEEEYDFISRCSMGSMGRVPQKRPSMARIPEEEEGESEAGWSKLSRHNTILKDPYTEKMRFRAGLCMACTVGLFGGSILVPLHYVPNAEKGLVFLPSFGAGTIVAAPIALMLYSMWSEEGMPGLFFWETLPYGLLSGCIFNAGNLMSIIAIPFLGYGVAYPILQCAIFVSGMWGVLYLKELQDPAAVRTFFTGGFVLISGAVVLTVAR
jgi:glucose uptake protein GlcU